MNSEFSQVRTTHPNYDINSTTLSPHANTQNEAVGLGTLSNSQLISVIIGSSAAVIINQCLVAVWWCKYRRRRSISSHHAEAKQKDGIGLDVEKKLETTMGGDSLAIHELDGTPIREVDGKPGSRVEMDLGHGASEMDVVFGYVELSQGFGSRNPETFGRGKDNNKEKDA